jgi:hypothetical protein
MKNIIAAMIRALAEIPIRAPVNINRNCSDARKLLTFSIVLDTINHQHILLQ